MKKFILISSAILLMIFIGVVAGCSENPLTATDNFNLTGDEVVELYSNGTTTLAEYPENPLEDLFFRDTVFGQGLSAKGYKKMFYRGELVKEFHYVTHGPGMGLEPSVYTGWHNGYYIIAVTRTKPGMYSGPRYNWLRINPRTKEISEIPTVGTKEENGLFESNIGIQGAKSSGEYLIFSGRINYSTSAEVYSVLYKGNYYNFHRIQLGPDLWEWQ